MRYTPFLKLSSFFANLFRKGNKDIWERILATMDTIEGLVIYYTKKKFIQINDRGADNYKQPRIFLEDESGDCDDFGKTSFEFMKRKNYTCWFVGIWKTNLEGHAIVVYIDKFNGLYNYVSNKKIVYGFDTFKECLEDFYGNETKKYEIIDKSN